MSAIDHYPLLRLTRAIEVKTHGPHKPMRIALHSTESRPVNVQDAIKGIIRSKAWQEGGLGSHWVVMPTGWVIECAPRSQITWAVQNRNTGTLHIEMVGFARYPHDAWPSAQVESVGKLCARMCANWDIPTVRDTGRGITTHRELALLFGGDHWDPGFGFPVDWVVHRAQYWKQRGGWA